MSDELITLGKFEDIPVKAQPYPNLLWRVGIVQKKLAVNAGDLSSGGLSVDRLIALAGENLYDVVVAAIPTVAKRVPRWEFAGYPTAGAMEAHDYDPDVAEGLAPTVPQVKHAFAVAAQVNGVDVVKHLGGVAKYVWDNLDPKLRQQALTVVVSDALAKRMDSPSTTSATSPAAVDGSPPSTSSGGDRTTTTVLSAA